mmetsp:Transcript_26717/g.67968  ORF Transcript_26717/g.67968 Transcript_26717/m.67968 type:complete len:294 (-) Transcript_26717:494-1375(-)
MTRVDDRCSASRSEKRMNSSRSIRLFWFSSSDAKRARSSSSVCVPASRSRIMAENSSKSSFVSRLTSCASYSIAFCLMPTSNGSSSAVFATSSSSANSDCIRPRPVGCGSAVGIMPPSALPKASPDETTGALPPRGERCAVYGADSGRTLRSYADGPPCGLPSWRAATSSCMPRTATEAWTTLRVTATAEPWRKHRLSSRNSILPPPSSSNSSKTASTCSTGACSPRAFIARRNSFLSTSPLPSSSHVAKRPITLAAFFLSHSRSADATSPSTPTPCRILGVVSRSRASCGFL